jgi:hypothetical protein
LSVRRLTATATAVATAAVCGALLVPAAAYADAGSADPVTLAITQVTHNALGRGEGTDTLTLTAANPTDAAQKYTGRVVVIPEGASPLTAGQVRVQIDPVSAPATELGGYGTTLTSASASFFPQGAAPGAAFSIPAHTSYSWKVTFGVRPNFPLNDDGAGLEFATRDHVVHQGFQVGDAQSGLVTAAFGPEATVASGRPARAWLEIDNGRSGRFVLPLSATVHVDGRLPGLTLEVLADGRWTKAVKEGDGTWRLPRIAAGFAHGDTHRYQLRFTATAGGGSARDVALTAKVSLTEGNTYPFLLGHGTLHYDPAAPAPTATSSASAPTTTPAATSTAPATPTSAPAAAGNAPATNAPAAELAHTGASQGELAGAAVLIAAAGTALTVTAARRRRGGDAA